MLLTSMGGRKRKLCKKALLERQERSSESEYATSENDETVQAGSSQPAQNTEVTICERIGCKKPATCTVEVRALAKGQSASSYEEAEETIEFRVCDRHARN